MKIGITFLLLLQVVLAWGQEKKLVISNTSQQKEIVFLEGTRVRVKTLDGSKISGKLEFIDDQTILIRGEPIQITRIEKIKRNPLTLSIINKGVFGGLSAAGITSAVLIVVGAIYVDALLIALLPVVAVPTMVALLLFRYSPNPLYGFKMNKGWSYTIQDYNKLD